MIGNTNKQINEPIEMKCRKLDENNMSKISHALRTVNWQEVSQLSAQNGYSFIVDKITKVLDTIAPEKSYKIDPSKIIREPWMTPGLIKSSKLCDKKYKKSCGLDKSHPKVIEYKDYRNLYNIMKRKAKRSYYVSKIEEFKYDSKKMWRILKEISGKANDKTTCSNAFHINGTSTNNTNIIRNEFSRYYSSMGKDLADQIGPSSKQPSEFMPPVNDSSLFLFPTNQAEIVKIVKKNEK